MPAHRFVTLDVFTTVRFGGNPLAVFPDASGLDGLAACAGLGPGEVRDAAVASVGTPAVCARVEAEALGRAGPDLAAFRATAALRPEFGGRFLLCLYALADDGSVRARVFAPL